MFVKFPIGLVMDLCLYFAKTQGAEAQGLFTQLRSVLNAPPVQRQQKAKRSEVPPSVG